MARIQLATSPALLKRLGLIIGLIALVALAFGTGLEPYKDYAEVASHIRLASLILLGLALGVMVAHYRRELKSALTSRQAKYGANATILTLSFVGVLCLANYIAHRHNLRWDLTANKSFSLSDQSRKIIGDLDKEVKVTVFYSANNSMRQQAVDLLESYRHYGKDKLKVEVVDPVRSPSVARQYNITTDGTIIFESGPQKHSVFNPQEQDFTNALLSITRETKPKIYFLQGHQELDPDGFDNTTGMGSLKQLMEKENYQIEKLSLLEKPDIPPDARALIIAGPEKPLTSQERQAIQRYIDERAGDVLILLRPQTQTGLESLLATYGILVKNDIIVDPARHFWQDVAAPAIVPGSYKFHEITKDMRAASFFPGTRSISLAKELPPHVKGTELTQTSPQSWGETDLKNTTQVKQDPNDTPGPLSVSAAVTIEPPQKAPPADKPEEAKKAPQARLVVFGNTLFAANGFSRSLGNGDFFMNALAWLAEEEALIGIRSKEPEQRQIELTNTQVAWVYNTTVYGMPALMLFLGGIVWWRRR